jgi:hypothetical protein
MGSTEKTFLRAMCITQIHYPLSLSTFYTYMIQYRSIVIIVIVRKGKNLEILL